MATSTHSALDGSQVEFSADADLSQPMTAFGFVRPDGWRTAQPLNIFPPGKSERVLSSVGRAHPEIDYELLGDVDVNGGTLRMARVRRPVATGGHREFVYGVWEGSGASITTSVKGDRATMEDLFDRMRFRELSNGIAVDSPVDESVRPLRCLKEVGRSLLDIRPLTPAVTRTLPRRGRGRAVANGEMFRRNETTRDVIVVTPTAAVCAAPIGNNGDEHVDLATDIAVTWGERA